MPTALICASTDTIRDQLQTELQRASYAVDCVPTITDLIALLKYEKRDVLISEVRKDCFAGQMQAIFMLDPSMTVQFFQANSVFCVYPASRQPKALVQAVIAAGIRISPRLLGQAAPMEMNSASQLLLSA